MESENKTRFFNTLAESSPAPSLTYWSIFERNLLIVGLADFEGSNSNGWPTGPVLIKQSKLGEIYEAGDLFRAIHPFSIEKSKLWASWPPVGTYERAKSANPTRFLLKIDQ